MISLLIFHAPVKYNRYDEPTLMANSFLSIASSHQNGFSSCGWVGCSPCFLRQSNLLDSRDFSSRVDAEDETSFGIQV